MSDRALINRKVEAAKKTYLDAKKILDQHDELEGDRLGLEAVEFLTKDFETPPFIDDEGAPHDAVTTIGLVFNVGIEGARVEPNEAIRFRDFLSKWLKRHGHEAS